MVGDSESDIEAGRLARCKTILIRYRDEFWRNEEALQMRTEKPTTQADHEASSMAEVAMIILNKQNDHKTEGGE